MKIVVSGYYGFGNIGDELILSSMLRQLESKYKGAVITILSANPLETTRSQGVLAADRWNVFSVLKNLWTADLFILGGGGLLQDGTSFLSLVYYLALIETARLFQASVVLYAIGVEKIQTKWGRWGIRHVLGHSSIKITVRDQESKVLLTEIGLKPERIHVTGDPVFARGVIPSSFARYGAKIPAVFFIPRFPCPPAGQRLYQKLLESLKTNRGYIVKGALFQSKIERPLYKKSFLSHYFSLDEFLAETSPEKFFEEVTHFDYVVSARFHGLVVAALAGRPFLGIGDPEKVGRFCHAWGHPFLPWDAAQEQIEICVTLLLSSPPNPRGNSIDEWRRAAEQTIEHVLVV